MVAGLNHRQNNYFNTTCVLTQLSNNEQAGGFVGETKNLRNSEGRSFQSRICISTAHCVCGLVRDLEQSSDIVHMLLKRLRLAMMGNNRIGWMVKISRRYLGECGVMG